MAPRGLDPPVDGVTTAIGNANVLADDARAKRLGFGAKLCIHPKQVDIVNRVFAPSTEEIAWRAALSGPRNAQEAPRLRSMER
jgi:citrate lyase subunit beta/citryl-CoA lyase